MLLYLTIIKGFRAKKNLKICMKENLHNFVEELEKLKTWDVVAAYF